MTSVVRRDNTIEGIDSGLDNMRNVFGMTNAEEVAWLGFRQHIIHPTHHFRHLMLVRAKFSPNRKAWERQTADELSAVLSEIFEISALDDTVEGLLRLMCFETFQRPVVCALE